MLETRMSREELSAALKADGAKRHKFGAKRTKVDGIVFASKFEAERYEQLKLLARAGQIHALELQPRFPLTVNGILICHYVGDFAYVERMRNVVEDTKGMVLPLYKLKRDLFLACYPKIDFREIKR